LKNIQQKVQESGVTNICEEELCPIECLTIDYSSRVHLTSYPTDFYLKFLQLQPNLINRYSTRESISQDIKNSVAKLNIFYNEISYTALTESPALTWDTLLSNIGGTLGNKYLN
jgi:hypothetical protein